MTAPAPADAYETHRRAEAAVAAVLDAAHVDDRNRVKPGIAEATRALLRRVADAILQAVHDENNAPSVLSISWGAPEDGWTGQAIAAMSAAFADAAALGVTVTAASGDALATNGEDDGAAHVDYPASDPLVLGCGGTRLDASDGRVTGEAVWNSNGGGTGGGVSALFARPRLLGAGGRARAVLVAGWPRRARRGGRRRPGQRLAHR